MGNHTMLYGDIRKLVITVQLVLGRLLQIVNAQRLMYTCVCVCVCVVWCVCVCVAHSDGAWRSGERSTNSALSSHLGRRTCVVQSWIHL